jgi:hypothetical protein
MKTSNSVGVIDSVIVSLQRPDGTEWERVKFPVAIWKAFEAAAESSGVRPEEFISRAMKEKLENDLPVLSSYDGEMYAAINQAEALNHLLALQVLEPMEGQPSDSIQCGIVELNTHTYDRLHRASKRTLGAAFVKGGAR